MSSNEFLWCEEYRPKTIDDCILPSELKSTFKKIVEAYCGHLPDDWKSMTDLTYRREGQDVRYALNDDKLRSLGWSPQKNFDKEIIDLVKHYRKNFKW